jgi:tRNA-2-methylthio-N6-dimethylallyladenosine synthase
MAKKLYIKTMGCQMNEYDSDKMADVLRESHGYELTDDADSADLLLVNTCSIREKAQEKVFSELGRWRPLKEKRPGVMIGVGGCVASQEGEGITKRAPFVDVVFGPQTLHRLPELLEDARARSDSVVDISFPEIEKFDRLPEPRAEGPTAFVSVMEGCSKYCSFCVVPYTRGEEISRPFDDVIAECVSLSQQGVSEINLLGQNVNAYRGPMHDGQIADLATLIYYVAAIESIERIRFTTSHPMEFTDSLIQAYAEVPKLANYLHLPVQHGSDRVLARMKRGHTILEYKQKIRKLREARPDISLSSDFIVGFPGETDDDFEQLMNLVAEIGFDQSFSFIYSARPGTPAASLDDDTPMDVKKQRLQPGDGWHHAARACREDVEKRRQPGRRQDREHALGQFRR